MALPILDDFSGGLDTEVWNASDASVVSGRLRLASNKAYSGEAALTTQEAIRDTAWSAEIRPPIGVSVFAWFDLTLDENNAFYTSIDQEEGTPGVLRFIEAVGGVESETNITYNATTHRWLRYLIEGTTVKWQTSEDGEAWTTRREKTTSLNVDGEWQFATGSGYWGSAPTPDYLEMDNFSAAALGEEEGEPPIKVYDGEAWQPATRHVYTGSEWVEA